MSEIDIFKSSMKIIDVLYGNIEISYVAKEIVNNKLFQRMKNLYQTGVCHYIFPSMNHTRFEHSIGTYYLAGKMIKWILDNNERENIKNCLKNITEIKKYLENDNFNYICELVKIAGLCHDLGHGPYSHLFDDQIINLVDHPLAKHELRSCFMIEHIINNNDILKKYISDSDIKFIKDLINPEEKNQEFIYQIISNNKTHMDVDKFDYIARDSYMLGKKLNININLFISNIYIIDNNICYSESACMDIARLFMERYLLYKQVYCHNKVISVQFMITDIYKLLDPIFNISNSIYDVEKFAQFNEHYLIFMLNNFLLFSSSNDEIIYKINEAKKIYDRLLNNDLYKLIDEFTSNKIPHISNVDNCHIYTHKIGFVSSNKSNPLNQILIYDEDDHTKIKNINIYEMSLLISKTYQEYVTMIFSK